MDCNVVTYDTLGNERHKAVCELRKMKLDTGSAVKKLAIALGIEWNADNAPKSVALLQKRLIHLLGGDQQPVKMADLFGIWKDGSDDVRGSVAALGNPAVHAAAGRGDDIHSSSGVEGLAPITTELRNACGDANDMVSFAAIESHDFDQLCDAIDAIHAGLERENAELRQRVAVLDNERGNMHDGWVRLPVDADGEYIHAGDVLDGYGKTIEVVEMRHGRSGWVIISRDGNGYADTFAFARHHAPTVEDVLREFADEMNQNLGMYTGEAIDADEWRDADNKTIAEFAAKLRLAEEVDG